MTHLRVGDLAPGFRARNQHGETVSLTDLRGAPVVVVFYPFAFTGICTSELASLQDNLADFRSADARLLAVSTDTTYTLRVFADQEHLQFDLLSDHWPHGQIASAYGVFDPEVGCAVRGSFLLDGEGRVSWRVVHRIGEPRDIALHLAALAQGRNTRTLTADSGDHQTGVSANGEPAGRWAQRDSNP